MPKIVNPSPSRLVAASDTSPSDINLSVPTIEKIPSWYSISDVEHSSSFAASSLAFSKSRRAPSKTADPPKPETFDPPVPDPVASVPVSPSIILISLGLTLSRSQII